MLDAVMLSEHADSLIAVALERSIVSGLLLLVVASATLLLRRVLSSHALSWLWLLPLVVLVVPVERFVRPLNVSGVDEVVAALPTWSPADDVAPAALPRSSVASAERAEVATRSADLGATASDSTRSDARVVAPVVPTPSAAKARWTLWLSLLWIGGAALLLLRLARNQLVARRRLATAVLQDTGRLAALAEKLGREAGVARPVQIALTDALASPSTAGVGHPIIYLPNRLAERLDDEQLRWVLLHELGHVRRGDVVTIALQRLVQIAWWWNPASWVTGLLADHWRECACDDAASWRAAPASRKSCARAFVEVLTDATATRHSPSPLTSLLDHRTLLRNRLMRLLDQHRTVTGHTSALSALLVLLIGATGLSLAAARAPQEVPRALRSSPVDRPPRPLVEQSPEGAMKAGIEWLLDRQRENGSWYPTTDGRADAGEHNPVNTTALATLALMELDAARKSELTRRAVARGLAFLVKAQDAEGMIGARRGFGFMQGHAYALIALSEAQRREADPKRTRVIQQAANFAQMARNPYRGWRYGVRDGDNDARMTSLMLVALEAARHVGAEINDSAFTDGRTLLDELTDKKTGHVGWMRRGDPMGRLVKTKESHPGSESEHVTAIASVARLDGGVDPMENKQLHGSISVVSREAPDWSPRRGSIDYPYWMWGMELMRRVGGYQARYWKKATIKALVQNQRIDRNGGAYWPAEDAWSLPGMEVYATAICLRTLNAALSVR